MTDGGVTVGVATNSDGTTHAGYGGIATCGSVWSCPQCAAVVATRRADDLADVMRAVDQLGGTGLMLTLTMQHKQGDRLGWDRAQRREWESLEERRRSRDRLTAAGYGHEVDQDQAVADGQAAAALVAQRGCWDAVSYGWERVTSGKRWAKDVELHGGLLGWAKATEVTLGVNGWHVHVHVLLCYQDKVTLADAMPLARRMFTRWQSALRKRGFDASGDMGVDGRIPGWDLRVAQLGNGDLADYFTKLAHEITSSHRKEGRRPGGRTPMQLLADTVETYRADDVARWWEWEAASDGRRQLTWSGGDRSLRALAGLGRDQTDEEIAEETIDADERIGLAPEVWGWVRAGQHETTVLDVAETTGITGLIDWLSDHGQSCIQGAGLGWIAPPDDPRTQPLDRQDGTGQGWQLSTPATLRPHSADGRALPRPSDRPPRWTADAHAVLRS